MALSAYAAMVSVKWLVDNGIVADVVRQDDGQYKMISRLDGHWLYSDAEFQSFVKGAVLSKPAA
jgi:hypothetical protein